MSFCLDFFELCDRFVERFRLTYGVEVCTGDPEGLQGGLDLDAFFGTQWCHKNTGNNNGSPMPTPKVVVISGHRDISPDDLRKVWAGVKLLVANSSVDEIWVGGARGVDNEALKAALHYRGEAKRPKLVVVVPDRIQNQPSECWEWIRRADSVIELQHPITAADKYASYRNRNEFMLNHGSALVAFWSGNKKSGTGSAVNYAKRLNIPVKHLPIGT